MISPLSCAPSRSYSLPEEARSSRGVFSYVCHVPPSSANSSGFFMLAVNRVGWLAGWLFPWTMDYRLWTIDCGLSSAGSLSPWTMDYRLWTISAGSLSPWTMDYRLRTIFCWFAFSMDHGLSTVDYFLLFGCRMLELIHHYLL